MDFSISTVINRLTCPGFRSPPVVFGSAPAADEPPADLQGRLIHAAAESYLLGEPIGTGLQLIRNVAGGETGEELVRQFLNLVSFLNQSVSQSAVVMPEADLSLSIQTSGCEAVVHGRSDCVIVQDMHTTVIDWKSSPRPDGLDLLQVRFYLAAALRAHGLPEGDWVLYYYRGGLRRGAASQDDLLSLLAAALERAVTASALRPGTHCGGCAERKECQAFDSLE